MVILGEVITILVVNSVVDREGTRPIGPDQGNQADPFDDFALIAAPLEVCQCDLLGMNFVDDGIIQNEPAIVLLNKGFNFCPQRLRG